LIDYIKILPNPLKSILLLTLADQLITQAHKDLAEEALSHIVEASLSNDAILLKQFLQLQIKRMKYAQTEPIELERLLRYVKNPTLMARLIMEGGFVDWKKKGHEKFIETLRSLIPLLEGDLLHAKALEYLIDYDVLMKNYLIVLDNAAILKNYYPKIYQQIKPKIQGILYYIICEKGFEKIGLIYTLQILNQFTEAIPVSPYVTEFILDLTQKLHRIGMLKESIQLLEAYFQRSEVKLTTDKQHDMVLQLLDFYVKSGNQRKALEFIDKIEHKKELNKDDAEIVRLLKARVALLNNDKEKALYFLQSSHELEGLKIKAAIFWELKNWSGAVDSISEIIDTYADRLDEERKERYIVHLAAALVLNEEKYQSRKMARQKTRITLNEVTQKYEKILKKYSTLLQELIIEPHNSLSDVLTKKVITDELKETDRLENLFNQVKAIPTH
jgi:hypothetical protein